MKIVGYPRYLDVISMKTIQRVCIITQIKNLDTNLMAQLEKDKINVGSDIIFIINLK